MDASVVGQPASPAIEEDDPGAGRESCDEVLVGGLLPGDLKLADQR